MSGNELEWRIADDGRWMHLHFKGGNWNIVEIGTRKGKSEVCLYQEKYMSPMFGEVEVGSLAEGVKLVSEAYNVEVPDEFAE